MKIAEIIFRLVAVSLIVWALWNGNKGWQEENEARNRAARKFPQPDDMERRDKEKARGKNYK